MDNLEFLPIIHSTFMRILFNCFLLILIFLPSWIGIYSPTKVPYDIRTRNNLLINCDLLCVGSGSTFLKYNKIDVLRFIFVKLNLSIYCP